MALNAGVLANSSSPIRVEVAIILARMQLDQEALTAALLHDVVEDTAITIRRYRRRVRRNGRKPRVRRHQARQDRMGER